MEQNTNPQVLNQTGTSQQVPHYGLPQMKPQMGFVEAIKTCLIEKYCCFSGRARRSEFWWWQLANLLIGTVLGTITTTIFFSSHDISEYFNDPTSLLLSPAYLLQIAVSLALLLPNLGVSVRRLHDIGKSGFLLLPFLVGIIPIVGTLFTLVYFVVFIVWVCRDSDPRPNKWGPSPKYN